MSTDCSIVLDVGGFVRVGFAPMDEIKLAEGWSSAELDRKARSGEVQRIRRGAYDCLPAKSLDRRDQHRRLIAATVRQTFVDTAVSHMSAAVLHQLPTWMRGAKVQASPTAGWQIVRWLWEDLYHPEELRRRLERAFERGLRAA